MQWYTRLLRGANIYLTVGTILLLCGAGKLSVGDKFGFVPIEDFDVVGVYALSAIGAILVLSALFMQIVQPKMQSFLNRKASLIFFVSIAILVIGLGILVLLSTEPPKEVSELSTKSLDALTSLQESHMVLVNAYMNQKKLAFEEIFFKEFSQEFLKNWKEDFRLMYKRDYDENRDFHLLKSDLDTIYQDAVAPIEGSRKELRDAISREYRYVIDAHETIDYWIKSRKEWNAAQRESTDHLLDSIKPGLSLDTVNKVLDDEEVKAKPLEFLGD